MDTSTFYLLIVSDCDVAAETASRRFLTGQRIGRQSHCSLLIDDRRVSICTMSDEYAQATPEQKLNIATYFVMSAPVGEVDEVVAGQSDRQTKRKKKQAHAPTAIDTREQRRRRAVGGRVERRGTVHASFCCHRRVAALLTAMVTRLDCCVALVSAAALSVAVRCLWSLSTLLLLQM